MRGCLFLVLGIISLASVYFLHWEIIPMLESNDLQLIMQLVAAFAWSLSALIGGIALIVVGVISWFVEQ